MNTKISQVSFTDDMLVVDLSDGRIVSVPLVWYPSLLHADVPTRNSFRLIGKGLGIHWPDLDEDLSLQGILMGIPAKNQEVA